jgi:hypothetical protein
VPLDARALSVNVTVTQAAGGGDLRLYPGDQALPPTSTINYAAGQTRANNAVVALAGDGSVKVRCDASGAAHLILDVNGYFT